MKLSGQHAIGVERQRVWDALNDPAVLARTLPGCSALEVTGPNTYAATITAGVASVKGTYQGQVSLADIDAPSSYTLVASGAGAPGTVRAEARVNLVDGEGGATTVSYEADAVVGGMIGGVGQRMLASVARRTAQEFFEAVERDLIEGPALPTGPSAPHLEAFTSGVDTAPGAAAAAPPVTGAEPGEYRVGQIFAAPSDRPVGAAQDRRVRELGVAVLIGAAIALCGVLVGRRLAR